MERPKLTCGPGNRDGLAATRSLRARRSASRFLTAAALVGLTGLGGLAACSYAPTEGDCGTILSSAECANVRTQLGRLDDHPPADPSNRFGRCVKDGTAECLLEDKAVKLGQRLFFDRCLSTGKNVACVTCHEPADAFADGRKRQRNLTSPYSGMMNGMPVNMRLPPIEPFAPENVNVGPPMVNARLDATGTPMATWDGQKWTGVMRLPQGSAGSAAGMNAVPFTGRHSPSLYNIAYGAVLPPSDGARVAGVIWAPWDGRYDSHWALVADVFEFGATQATDRSHIALRIWKKHRADYEAMIGTPMPPGFDTVDISGKFVYPRHGSPASGCWWDDPSKCTDAVNLPPTAQVRDDINTIFVNAGKALSSYMRRIRSNQSAYDRFMAGDYNALSEPAQRGLQLFMGKAECILCHSGPNFTDGRFHNLGVPHDDPESRTAGSALISTPDANQAACFEGIGPTPYCTDPGRNGWQARAAGDCDYDAEDFTLGMPTRAPACQRVDQPARLKRFDIEMDCRSAASDATDKDTQCLPTSVASSTKCAYGAQDACDADPLCNWVVPPVPRNTGRMQNPPRCVARGSSDEVGQFKTPTLRNISLTFPYMHNGALYDYGPSQRGELDVKDATPHLRRVVRFYNQGGGVPASGTRDMQLRPLGLTDREIDDVVEFLMALKDDTFATHELSAQPTDLADVMDCPD